MGKRKIQFLALWVRKSLNKSKERNNFQKLIPTFAFRSPEKFTICYKTERILHSQLYKQISSINMVLGICNLTRTRYMFWK